MSRDMGYYWLRLVIYITLSVCLGSIYFNLNHTYSSILVCTSYFIFHKLFTSSRLSMRKQVWVEMNFIDFCVLVPWQGRAGCIAYVGGFLTFMSIGGFPSFVEDMKVIRLTHFVLQHLVWKVNALIFEFDHVWMLVYEVPKLYIKIPLWKLIVDCSNSQNIFLLKNVENEFFFLLVYLVTFFEASWMICFES